MAERLTDTEMLLKEINNLTVWFSKEFGKTRFVELGAVIDLIHKAQFIDKKRVVVLPCALGETLWRVCEFRVITGKPAFYVRAVELNENNFYRIIFGGEYGKLVFDTKEEAVEAMEKMKNA